MLISGTLLKQNEMNWLCLVCAYEVRFPLSNHYLKQCWDIINWTLTNKLQLTLNPIYAFSVKKLHFELSSAKLQPFCLGLNVLIKVPHLTPMN